MKWLNHGLIADAICVVASPPHIPICVVGAITPDWMEFVAKGLGRNIKHRGAARIFTHWLIAALVFTLVWDFQGIGMDFA
ncbi:hypothetical protein THF5G08_230017 [Vibrio jasicida]|nr:hypothetical protein THF5G08_230017 [Vibrio jasicida]